MRVIRLALLGLIAYVVSVLFLFPAAPVIDRLQPMLHPVQISGVEGSLLSGHADRITYNDDVVPIELSNVWWRLAPKALLSGAAGVDIGFEAYGGAGNISIAQRLNGDIEVSDAVYQASANGLEALLPLPVAQFTGQLRADIESVAIHEKLLKTFRGKVNWADAQLEAPIRANLGNISLDVKPVDDQTHRGFLVAAGGEIDVEGTVDLRLNGDFIANMTITPRADASPELLNALRGLGRPDQGGRYRIQRNGNVNRLM